MDLSFKQYNFSDIRISRSIEETAEPTFDLCLPMIVPPHRIGDSDSSTNGIRINTMEG